MAIIPGDEKVFMVSNGTNTTYGGSAALQAMNQWYTMEDISDSVVVTAPYKVFTALLTQSGVWDQQLINSGDLIIGVTYRISFGTPGIILGDFTNVGAPNNEIGTSFVATGITPNSWGTDIVLLYNTGAPVATILENTIGNVWFTYWAVGNYIINSNDLFTSNKTYIDTKNIFGGGQGLNIFEDIEESDTNGLRFLNYAGLQDTPILVDGIDRGRIEIRVYN